MKSTLRQRLLDDASIATLVGTRIYPGTAPRGTALPFVTLQRISSRPDHNLSGGHPDFYDELWDIDIYSDADAEAEALRELIAARLDGIDPMSWPVPSSDPAVSYYIYLCRLEDSRDDMEQPDDGAQEPTYTRTETYRIKRRKTAA